MILPVGSVVTTKTICEFDLLKISIEQYHDCEWVISCDEESYEKYKDIENIECLNIIESDDCDHNLGSEEQKDNWMKVMMTKFDVASLLIEKYGHGLFLDCDMIFVNPIEEAVLKLFQNKNIDACICQHMTNDWQNEAQHGLYNGGMFHIRSKNFIKEWKALSSNYKKYGLYYEQQPLEFIQRNFITANLPINYNIGWWRFNRPDTQSRLSLLRNFEDKIFFGQKPAINFHVHTLREIGYQNFGQFLVDKVSGLFEQSSNDNYKIILGHIKNGF